jgi:hypothetical protein
MKTRGRIESLLFNSGGGSVEAIQVEMEVKRDALGDASLADETSYVVTGGSAKIITC